jgi:hypothetical protein
MRRKSGPALKSGSGRVANNVGANALSVRTRARAEYGHDRFGGGAGGGSPTVR